MQLVSSYHLNDKFALIVHDWKKLGIDYVIVTRNGDCALDSAWVDVYVPTAQYEQALRISQTIEAGMMA